MFWGYSGRLLYINLTTGEIETKPLDKEFARLYVGGRGLGARLLHDLLPEKTDPLGSENVLLVMTGPITGTLVPGGCKYVVITKSPVSGGFVDSYASGKIAFEIKSAGYDGIVITGAIDNPGYIEIEDDRVEIKDAGEYWGLDTFEAERALCRQGEKDYGGMFIGPAGENRVKYATINSDMYRQAARGGVGAVMGSKNLKAIIVRGTGGVKCYDGQGVMDLVLSYKETIADKPTALNTMKYGTPSVMDLTNRIGMLPVRNFTKSTTGKVEGTIDSQGYYKHITKDKACYGCLMGCSKIARGNDEVIEGPEYETMCLLGSNLEIYDLPTIIKANLLCDKLGIDTISTGNVIGFVMECSEKGLLEDIIDPGELPGLQFGSGESLFYLIEAIAKRRGFGNILAEGVKYIAGYVGKHSEKFAMHSKGLEFPAYEPRGGFGTALAYAVSPRGACHRRAWPPSIENLGNLSPFTGEGKARVVKELYDKRAILHCLLACDFPASMAGVKIEEYSRYLTLVTGIEYTVSDLQELADRVETVIRLFNIREGLSRKEDNLPYRTLNEPLQEGPAEGQVIGQRCLEMMKDDYYELRGWDRSGIPEADTLKSLRIKLENRGGS